MKQQLRQQILNQLNMMSEEQYAARSAALVQQLLAHDCMKQANVIAVTMSAFPEVDTKPLIEALWQQGKRVAIPKCTPKTRDMHFYEIESFNGLKQTYGHLYEPNEQLHTYVAPEAIDVIIVPGVVYNKEGYRIGFGGGYYDRYLPKTNAYKIAMAFREQLQPSIPLEPHDCAVDTLLVER